jgi:hypothetical protein
MKYFKIFALSVLFLIKYNLLFAQKEISDCAKAYEYWAKRGVIEIVCAYMNDYITTVSDPSLPNGKIKNCTKEKSGLAKYENQFVTPLGEMRIEEINSTFNDVSAFLINNNWAGAEKNVLQPLIVNLKNRKPLTNDFFNTLKPPGNENSTNIPGYNNRLIKWNETVERIISDYNKDLMKVKQIMDSGSVSKVPTKSNENFREIREPLPLINSMQKWLIIALSSLLSFLFGIFFCYYFIKSRIYYFLDDDVETYRNSVSHTGMFSFLSMVRLLKKRKDEYKNKVAELNKEIIQSEKKTLQYNNTTVKSNSVLVENETQHIKAENTAKSIEWNLSNEVGNKSTSYFSIPENDGRFIIDKGEQTNDGTKYYKIEYKINSDEGDLFYINGTQDKRAINRLDSYLKPVCDIENIINAESASKIEVLSHGNVIKIADSWVIDTNHKVKIKLV